jgi:hypothetical protein
MSVCLREGERAKKRFHVGTEGCHYKQIKAASWYVSEGLLCIFYVCLYFILKNKDTGEPSGTFGRDLDLFRRRPMSWKDRCHWLVRYGSQINMAAASNLVLFFFNIKVDGTEIFFHTTFQLLARHFFFI